MFCRLLSSSLFAFIWIGVAMASPGGSLTPVPVRLRQELPESQKGVLAGRVLLNGKPLSGIRVQATSFAGNVGTVAIGKSDAEGRYRIEGVVPGMCVVSADLGPLADRYVVRPITGIPLREGKERDGLDLRLEEGIPLKVRVIRREDDRPLANAAVSIMPEGASTQLQAKTNEKGEATLRAPAGSLYVNVRSVDGREMDGHRYAWINVDADHHPDVEIRIPGALTLAPIPSVKGQVVGIDGKPVAGAEVIALGDRSVAARTNEAGRFEMKGPIAAGSVVLARKEGRITGKGVPLLSDAALRLALDSDAATISGTTVDDEGYPLANVEVSIGGEVADVNGEYRTMRTDAAGKWAFSGLYPGTDKFFVWFKAKGRADETIQPIRVSARERKAFPATKMSLRDGTVDGRLVDEAGKPVVGLQVSAQRRGDDGISDETGAFHLKNVARGDLVVAIGDGRIMWQAEKAHTGQKDLVIKVRPRPSNTPGTVSTDQSGQKLEELSVAEWIQGTPMNLASLQGKVVVLDLWATWCGPCVAGMPKMDALYRRHQAEGLVVIGVHSGTDSDKEKIRKVLKEKGVTFPIALDALDASGRSVMHLRYGNKGIPHYLVVGRDGRIALDGDEEEAVEKTVERLLTEKRVG